MTRAERIAKLKDTCMHCGHSRRPHNSPINGPHPFEAHPSIAIIEDLEKENEELKRENEAYE